MKTWSALFSAILISNFCMSQNLITNGSFEINSAVGNTTNLTTNWPSYVTDSWEVDAGVMSLITSNNCGTASDGSWFVTNCPGCSISASYIAFSLKLSTPLITGNQYTVSFDKKNCGDSTQVEFGITNDSTLAGNLVHTFSGPSAASWVQDSYIFQAPSAANYITVSVNVPVSNTGFIALDNFELFAGAVAINEPFGNQNSINIYPNPATNLITIYPEYSGRCTISEIAIYNALGKKVYCRQPETMNHEPVIINVSSFPSGIYFIRIFDSQKSFLKRLVVE